MNCAVAGCFVEIRKRKASMVFMDEKINFAIYSQLDVYNHQTAPKILLSNWIHWYLYAVYKLLDISSVNLQLCIPFTRNTLNSVTGIFYEVEIYESHRYDFIPVI